MTEQDDVFKYNAWDDVEWDENQEEHAKKIVEANSTSNFSSEEIIKLKLEADQRWDKFYDIHQNRNFKDRNWLFTEFPELNDLSGGSILELGCGVGNSIFPILKKNVSTKLTVFGCDFSRTAVDLLKQHPEYENGRCEAFVCDIAQKSWANVPFEENSLDMVILIFVLSALDPSDMELVVDNIKKYLKPGGKVLFRDYGRFDMTQLRLKPGQCLADNFYVRGNGTRRYFFDKKEIVELFSRKGFSVELCKVDQKLQVNRSKKLKMYRVWLLCKFVK